MRFLHFFLHEFSFQLFIFLIFSHLEKYASIRYFAASIAIFSFYTFFSLIFSIKRTDCCAVAAASARHDAHPSSSCAWFSWLDDRNGSSLPSHIASSIGVLAAQVGARPCVWLATWKRHTNQTTKAEPAGRQRCWFASSWHTILLANVTFFHHQGTISRKKAFLNHYEKLKITPININMCPALSVWLHEIPRKPQ